MDYVKSIIHFVRFFFFWNTINILNHAQIIRLLNIGFKSSRHLKKLLYESEKISKRKIERERERVKKKKREKRGDQKERD